MPQPLIEDGRERAAYDVEKGELQVKVAKKTSGQIFENLDMLSLLLGVPTTVVEHDPSEVEDITHIKAQQEEEDEEEDIYSKLVLKPVNSRPVGYKPSIEVIGETKDSGFEAMGGVEEATETSESAPAPSSLSADVIEHLIPSLASMEAIEEDDDEYDWSHPQEVPRPFAEEPQQPTTNYGFMDLHQGFFDVEHPDSVDIEDPDVMPEESRRQARLLTENSQFSYDHYMADFMDTTMVDEARAWVAPWTNEYDTLRQYELNPETRPAEIAPGIPTTPLTSNDELAVVWTDDHRNALLKLPRREYPHSGDHTAMLGLVDLIFAYAYNLRSMEGENTVESSWTIVKLSSSLAWFDKLNTLQEALISSARRAVIYPIYRNWTLVQSVFQDVYQLFYLGKRALLRALLEMKHICDTSETRHLLSHLYLNDYCIWIQRISKKKFAQLAAQILDMTERISKSDVGLPLEELESLAMEDAQDGNTQT